MLLLPHRSETNVDDGVMSGDLGWDKRDWWLASQSAGQLELEKCTNVKGKTAVKALRCVLEQLVAVLWGLG